ncbi:hypothetical protein HUG17_0525 [Dermatophagoides farinae]|uniref:Mediator of RNA polymerase II transcription subunit 15 n=1 Tax=Dermatophagoides farinae TaxID=6954 RepID=A0A9D4P6T8_DERFA|nr:mediator of RNA polymerase II transcription subunit 15-like [Dermatophagoides farinae]KAH7644987.1 hypothetical protein HUG17_0525 [Dermatophagoides farinae]
MATNPGTSVQPTQQATKNITNELRQRVLQRMRETIAKTGLPFVPEDIENTLYKRYPTPEDYWNHAQNFLKTVMAKKQQSMQQQQQQQQQQMMNQNAIALHNMGGGVGPKPVGTHMMMTTTGGHLSDSIHQQQQQQKSQQMMATNNSQRPTSVTMNKMMAIPTAGSFIGNNQQQQPNTNVTAITNQSGTANVVLNANPQMMTMAANKAKIMVSNQQQFQQQQANQQQLAAMQMQQQQTNQMTVGSNQQPTMTLQSQLQQQGTASARMMQPNQMMNQRMLAATNANASQIRQINQNIQLRIPRQQLQQQAQLAAANIQQTVSGQTHMMSTIGQQQQQTSQQPGSVPILVLQHQQQPRQINTQQIQIQMQQQLQSGPFQDQHPTSRMTTSTAIQQQQFINKANQMQHVNTANMQSTMAQQQPQQAQNSAGNMAQAAQFANQFGQQAQIVTGSSTGGQTLISHQQQAIAVARQHQQQQQVSVQLGPGNQATMMTTANTSIPSNDNNVMGGGVGPVGPPNKGLLSAQILTANQQPQSQPSQQQSMAGVGVQPTQPMGAQQQQQPKILATSGSVLGAGQTTTMIPANHHAHHHGSPVNSNFIGTGSPAAPQLMPSPASRPPHSIETPSPQNQPLNTPGSVPTAQSARTKDQLYQEKLQSMQKYIEPLKEAMQKNDMDDSNKDKTRNLYQILTGVNRTTLELLERCEASLESQANFLANKNLSANNGTMGKMDITNHNINMADLPSLNKSRLTASGMIPTMSSLSLLSQSGSSTVHSRMQDTCQSLLDAVTRNFRKPTYFHVAHKTFGPALSVLNPDPYLLAHRVNVSGNYICYNNVSGKTMMKKAGLVDRRIETWKRRMNRLSHKKPLPDILQGEIARLDLRFKVQALSARRFGSSKCQHLLCRLDDSRLPSVPPIIVYIPEDYPNVPPYCELESEQYKNCHFFSRIYSNFGCNMRHMPMRYSFTLLLHIWERSIQQAMCSISDTSTSLLSSSSSMISSTLSPSCPQQQDQMNNNHVTVDVNGHNGDNMANNNLPITTITKN